MNTSKWVRGAYVGSKSRIVMSVAMANGGHLFASWLRDKLMKSLNYYSSRAIFLDTVDCREKGTDQGTNPTRIHDVTTPNPHNQTSGNVYVSPDWRYRTGMQITANGGPLPSVLVGDDAGTGQFDDVGYVPIGASDKAGWKSDFEDAVQEARVMLFIETPEFYQSNWCMAEWNVQAKEAARRNYTVGNKQKKLFTLALRELSCGSPARPINVKDVEVVPFKRVPMVINKLAGWGLSDTVYQQLVDKLKPNLA
jgi:hypothetical protein